MKKIKVWLLWIHWKFTGYRELSDLIRGNAGFNGGLTPTGIKRAEELASKEAHLRRLLKEIEKL
jgi:hypothetical protein